MFIENHKTIGTLETFINTGKHSEADNLAYQTTSARQVIRFSWLELYELPDSNIQGSEWFVALKVGKKSFWNALWTPHRVIEQYQAMVVAKTA